MMKRNKHFPDHPFLLVMSTCRVWITPFLSLDLQFQLGSVYHSLIHPWFVQSQFWAVTLWHTPIHNVQNSPPPMPEAVLLCLEFCTDVFPSAGPDPDWLSFFQGALLVPLSKNSKEGSEDKHCN